MIFDDMIDCSDPRLSPNYVSFDDAANTIFEAHGLPRLGGASGRGWSSYSAFQRCPRLVQLRRREVKRVAGRSLELGSMVHVLIALHYSWMRDENWPLAPEQFYDAILVTRFDRTISIEAWRLYTAYADFYAVDYLTPLAVEEWAMGPDGNTCRYDLIARVDKTELDLTPGAWIVEHKTMGRFDDSGLDGWRNDGEVFGQIMVWMTANLTEKYGPLQGVIVNIIGKHKVPKFHRTIVPAQAWHIDRHAADLRMWRAMEAICEATGVWPQARANCLTRYGKCEYFDVCAENREQ